MNFLKQSTATTVLAGPFVSNVDGYTANTGLGMAQSVCLLWKEGGTSQSAKNDSSAGTHRSNGHYTIPLDATDTNTLGKLTLTIKDGAPPTCLPVRHDFMVIPANAYDSLVLGTDVLTADVTQLNGAAASAARLALSAGVMIPGTVDTTATAGSTTEFESDDVTEATADHYKGCVIAFTSGALLGQKTSVSAYSLVSGRGHFTVAALTETPANNTTFIII